MAVETKPLNVYQRLGVVQSKCDAIKPDRTHPHHKFDYVSIQNVSNHLRKFCGEAGVKVTASFDPERQGWVRVDAVNLDDPRDRDLAWYPEIPDDKGHAYSTKYALIRYFNIGDGEEGDEAVMATKSAAGSTARVAKAAAPVSSIGSCPRCGKAAVRKSGEKNGKPWSMVGCAGFPTCRWIETGAEPAVTAAPIEAGAPQEEEAEQPWLGVE